MISLRVSGGSFIVSVLSMLTGQVLAAAETGGYLTYQEPQPTSSSWLATGGYILSLLLVFLIVLGLAYLTSRFLGERMSRSGGFGSGKIYVTLSLGPNRAVYVVELAGKFLILGVTDRTITLLSEITSQTDIEQLMAAENTVMPPETFSSVFYRQLNLLKQMQIKFPHTFSSDTPESREKEHETDIRKR